MKKFLTYVSLAVILFATLTAAVRMSQMPRTYDGQNATVPVVVLQQSPESYDVRTADGAAAAIVQENLQEARAVNDVTSVVFDFRGYDTMGEAFILITAVAGSAVILFTKAAKKEETAEGKEDQVQ